MFGTIGIFYLLVRQRHGHEDMGLAAEHVGVGTLVVTSGLQVVVVQLLPAAAAAAVQLATGTLVVVTGAQVVAVQRLPELAATGVPLATPGGPGGRSPPA